MRSFSEYHPVTMERTLESTAAAHHEDPAAAGLSRPDQCVPRRPDRAGAVVAAERASRTRRRTWCCTSPAPIATTSKRSSAAARSPAIATPSSRRARGQSKAQIRGAWDESVRVVGEVLNGLEPSQMMQTTDRTGKTTTFAQVLLHVSHHNATHMGQILWATKELHPGCTRRHRSENEEAMRLALILVAALLTAVLRGSPDRRPMPTRPKSSPAWTAWPRWRR